MCNPAAPCWPSTTTARRDRAGRVIATWRAGDNLFFFPGSGLRASGSGFRPRASRFAPRSRGFRLQPEDKGIYHKVLQRLTLRSRRTCPFDPSSKSPSRRRRSKAPASSCGARSASATPDEFDPFLLLDDFRNDNPDDYLAGFPWHPHRGIETITYVLAGTVEHGDSLGNRGSLGAGDVQWMTAGSGILHQEMPQGDAQGRMHGFQLWANLPSSLKMTAPRYQDVSAADIPEVTDDDGTRVRVICGDFWGKTGPVDGVAADPRYLDVSVPPGSGSGWRSRRSRHAFAYVFAGSGTFRDASEPRAS